MVKHDGAHAKGTNFLLEASSAGALSARNFQGGGGGKLDPVPTIVFGPIQRLVGGVNHLLRLPVARAGLGDPDADRH